MPRRLSKPRPNQGARLVELRTAAGLSQAELAKLIGEPQANVGYWETSSKPPRADVIPKLAKVLGVRVEALLDANEPIVRRGVGPVGKVRKIFDEVSLLPRQQQERVVDVVAAMVEQYRRHAG
ncbi:MAG: helix-turn-helix transcriptional regulator [Acidobacteriota bacterium]